MDEKNEKSSTEIVSKDELATQETPTQVEAVEGRRQSVALNIIQNPLTVSSHNFSLHPPAREMMLTVFTPTDCIQRAGRPRCPHLRRVARHA